MSRAVIERLQDAYAFACSAADHAGGLSAEDLQGAHQRRHAALHALAVVGEALSRVPAGVRELAPDIPWGKIVRTRHIVIHSYWQVDLAIIAAIVEQDLTRLISSLNRLIALVRQTSEA